MNERDNLGFSWGPVGPCWCPLTGCMMGGGRWTRSRWWR